MFEETHAVILIKAKTKEGVKEIVCRSFAESKRLHKINEHNWLRGTSQELKRMTAQEIESYK